MSRLIKLAPYVIGALFVAAVWIHGNSHGKQTIELEYQQAAIDMQESIRIVTDELAKAQAKRETITKEVVRNVYIEKDATGCADMPALDSVYNALR
jgi:hypothetical protein